MHTGSNLPAISPLDAKRLMAQGATLIDIRASEEHARERIQSAHNVPLSGLSQLENLTGPVIFHCRGGKRTNDNARQLRAATGCEAYMLAGGIDAWKQAGLPVIADASQRIEIGRQVMIAAGALALLGVLLGTFVRPELYGLSALIGAGLVFAGISGWCGLAKLLAVMPWNQRRLGV